MIVQDDRTTERRVKILLKAINACDARSYADLHGLDTYGWAASMKGNRECMLESNAPVTEREHARIASWFIEPAEIIAGRGFEDGTLLEYWYSS